MLFLPCVIFAVPFLHTVLPPLEFVYTKLCLKIYNLEHWNLPSFKFGRLQRGRKGAILKREQIFLCIQSKALCNINPNRKYAWYSARVNVLGRNIDLNHLRVGWERTIPTTTQNTCVYFLYNYLKSLYDDRKHLEL